MPTTPQAKELLHTQLNAESQSDTKGSSSKQLVEKKDIKDTPFSIIRFTEENGETQKMFLAMGKHRMTEYEEVALDGDQIEQKLTDMVKFFNWELMLKVLATVITTELDIREQRNKYQPQGKTTRS